jgi:undecaprenyl-diphosphatase
MAAGPLLAAADWTGRHALPVYLALLALLLAGTWAGGRALGWMGRRRGAATARVVAAPGPADLRLAAAVIAAAAAVFTLLALQLGAGDSALRQADRVLSQALGAHLPPLALQAFGAITHLGDSATLSVLGTLVAIGLALAGRPVLALGWAVALAGNGVLNQVLKPLFGRLRPLLAAGSGAEPGYSFPSGHSSGATVACGMLAWLALRLLPPRWHGPAVLVAVALAFTVGASRVFLRMHFASDVLAGFASGAVWLGLCVAGLELVQRRDAR